MIYDPVNLFTFEIKKQHLFYYVIKDYSGNEVKVGGGYKLKKTALSKAIEFIENYKEKK